MAKRDPHFPINLKTLPASWAHARVGDVVATIRPGFASGKHTDEPVGVPHLRPMNISREGRLDLSVLLHVPAGNDLRVRPGDVLFNNTNSRELVGKTAPINDKVHAQWKVLDELNQLIAQNLKRSAELRFTIMDQAFKGKLTRVSRRKRRVDHLAVIRDQVTALREEEGRLQREDQVARRKARAEAPHAEPARRELVERLRRTARIEATALFEELGYSFEERDDVDAFYEELSAAVRTRRVELIKGKKDATYVKALI